MLYKTPIWFALACMFADCTYAQNIGEIHGKVSDEENNPVEMVLMVATNGADFVTDETDANGRFHLKPLTPGLYDIMAIIIGYDSLKMSGVLVEADRITFLNDLTLTTKAAEMESIVIYEYEKPLLYGPGEQMETVTADDLIHSAAAQGGDLNKIVTALTSDIQRSPDGKELYFRGSRSGGTIFFIDGMKVTANNISIPASGIQTLSAYTGGVPARYGDTTGGVIVVETKNYLIDYYKKVNAMHKR